MKNLLYLLTLTFAITTVAPMAAQVKLKLQLQPDGQTYTVFARSQTDLLPPIDNITYNAQVAILTPTGSFELAGMANHVGQWQLTNLVQHPSENPSVDYALFSLTAATADIIYTSGQELPLFSFKNKLGCAGVLEIMSPANDPFLPPNSLNLDIRCKFNIEGLGATNALVGVYDTGGADCYRATNCLINNELELLSTGFYQISLVTDANYNASSSIESVQVAVKVPTNFFQIHGLVNLMPSQFSFGSISRFDSPAEDGSHDYLQFRLNTTGMGLNLQAGAKIPLLQFANGGSCQGDSIFLLKNDDPFLPPNSQSASIGQLVKFFGSDAQVPICTGTQVAAPCDGCHFTAGLIKLDSVQSANPVVCLGGANGILRVFAHGAHALEYSIDGGLSWSASAYFTGLGVGTYFPQVRGTKFGCQVIAIGQPVDLVPGTAIELKIEVPATVCEGSEVQLKIMSPNPLPSNASFSWTGPQGFSQLFADPVIFHINNYQSGVYTLQMNAPGCDVASASANLQVNPLPGVPDILSNGPICAGEKLKVFSNANSAKYEWYSPLGAAGLILPNLTTFANQTFIEPISPAYLSGSWQVLVTDTNGCQAMSPPLDIHIKPRPQAFAETTGPVCQGGQAQLLSNPLPEATYEWKVQGESAVFSMQPNPLIYNVLVSQTFQLVVTKDGCVSSVPALATISLNPQPSLNPQQQYTPATDCAPKPLHLLANATGTGLSYQWVGPSGFASQVANPVIAAATAASNGNYQLQAINIYGCTASQEVTVSNVPDPVVMPLIQGTGPACPGDEVQLMVQPYSGNQVYYQWFRGTTPIFNQTSNALIFNAIQTSDGGIYKLRATVGGCVVESANYLVDVLSRPQPNADFYLTNPCEGGSLQFFSNINGIADWNWTGPSGFYSDSPNPVIYNVEFNDIGAYELTVTGTNGCTANANLLVDGILPVPDAPLVASNSPVCPESEIILTVQNPTTTGTVSYQWQNAHGEDIGTGEATLILPSDDSLAVPPFLVKTIVNTCPSVLSDPVPVQLLPVPVALAWNGGAVCEGEMAQLFAATQPNASYEWQVVGQPQVVSIEQNPVLSLAHSTDFQLIVKTNGCAAEAVGNTSVVVNPVPVIDGLSGGIMACEGSPVNLSAANSVPMAGAIQYSWSGPNGYAFTGYAASSGPFPLVFPAVSPQNEGAYTLSLTSAEGCQSALQSINLEVGSMPATPLLTVADALLCESETLQLDATPANGSNISYDWYFNNGLTDVLLATTAFPTYFLASVAPSNMGSYFVKTTVDGCTTPPSNLVSVTVMGLASDVQASNPTTLQSPACEGADIQLSATLIPGASYHWYGPAGFYSDLPNPILENAVAAQTGSYLAVIGQPGCSTTLEVQTNVFVLEAPETPILIGEPTACEGTDIALAVANAALGISYEFYFGQNGQPFAEGDSTAVLENIGIGDSGSYFASASLNGCKSALSTPFYLQVLPAQTDMAFAGSDITLCEANETTALQATLPSVGSGYWTSLDGATVVQPGSANSIVIGILPGPNRFVWTLTNGICPGVGSDTTMIYMENIKAVEDFYSLSLNDTLLNINLLENDFTHNAPDFEFFMLQKPTKGQLFDDGTGHVTYIPFPNAFGEDGFSYRICSMNCPDICDEATVRISLDGALAGTDCFCPNLITPNGDALDDVFVIPCATSWPGSKLLVFNRWGSIVFESKEYQNDWGGTYDGQPLPPATYFYQLVLNDGHGTMLQGFVVVE